MASNFFGAFGIADDFMKKTDIIIQSESYDNSTDTILMWLHHYGTFNKIHLFFNNYVVDNFSLLFSGQKKKSVKINDININNCSFWYRRGEYTITTNQQNEALKKNVENVALVPLISYLNRFFQTRYINLFNDNFINKITVLEHCLDLGIKKTCMHCEFRHICTDCRAYLDDPEDRYSKPLKCSYDPFTTKWDDWTLNPLKNKVADFYTIPKNPHH